MRPALAIHGAGGGSWEWDIWRRVWGDDLCAIDLHPLPDVAATRLVDYESQVARACEEGDFTTLIGASLGAILACRVAAKRPIANLILVNPAVDMASAATGDRVRRWSQSPALSTHRALGFDDWYAARHALHRWRDESGAALADLASCVPPHVLRPRTLLLISEHDEEVAPEAMRRWGERVRASCHGVPEATHLTPLLGRVAPACARLAKTFAMKEM